MADQEVTAPIKPLRNSEIDAHPLLDHEYRKLVKVFRNKDRSLTMMDFARIALRATATDYTSDPCVPTDRALQYAALLFVYEALKACDHDIITQWPDFDTMLKCLEDLNTLGLPR